jgi:hypothetical protein
MQARKDDKVQPAGDAEKTADGLSNESVIAIANNKSEFLDAMVNTTSSFGSIDNVAYRGHSGELGLTFGMNVGMKSKDMVDGIKGLMQSGDIKFSDNAMFVFASCNSEKVAQYTTKNLGIPAVGANETTGSSHYLFGNGTYNTSLIGDDAKNASIGFTLFKRNNTSTSLGKVIDVPKLFETGKNRKKVSTY